MYQFPEPPPIGYYIDDVDNTFLTDGVLLRGNRGPSHKCIAKQLKPIPRKPSDPLAPKAEVEPRVIEKWATEGKAWYVDDCGRNAWALHAMLARQPGRKVDLYSGGKSKVSPFPRSEQYEYQFIRNKRIQDLRKPLRSEDTECVEMEKGYRGQISAFEYTQKPFWWKDKIPKRVSCTVGLPNDYAFRSLDPPGGRGMLIRKKLLLEDSEAYAPGAIHGQEYPEENSMQQTLDKADAVKVLVRGKGQTVEDTPNLCNCSLYAPEKASLCYVVRNAAPGAATETDSDLRWHPFRHVFDVPKDDAELSKAMLGLQKPYLHEINTWYSINKPANEFPPLTFDGKKSMLK